MSAEAVPRDGLCALGVPLLLLDSIAFVGGDAHGAVVVSGSHGGSSAARYAIAMRPLLTAFNDAGVLFILVVFFFPKGVLGTLREAWARRAREPVSPPTRA